MTTYAGTEVVCGNCSRAFTHQTLASCYNASSPDLDTRPSEMARSTMHSWIQRCPNCGFCAVDASKFDGRCREILLSDDYQNALRGGNDTPKLPVAFHCAAMLYEACGDRASAGWEHLHLAWIYDDTKQSDLALNHRNKAADLFLSILNNGESFSSQDGASEAIVTDVLRRAGRGQEALQLAEQALTKSISPFIKSVIVFERDLISNNDTAVHFMEEITQTKS